VRIRALANGNVIEASEEAAKELIEHGIYEQVSDDTPQTAEEGVRAVEALTTADAAPLVTRPAKRLRRTR